MVQPEETNWKEVEAEQLLARPEMILFFGERAAIADEFLDDKSVKDLSGVADTVLNACSLLSRTYPRWNLWGRFTGAELEFEVRREISRLKLPRLLEDGKEKSAAVRKLLDHVLFLESTLENEREEMQAILEHGRSLLEQLPESTENMEYPQRRLARRLSALETLLIHEQQMRMQYQILRNSLYAALQTWQDMETRVYPLLQSQTGIAMRQMIAEQAISMGLKKVEQNNG